MCKEKGQGVVDVALMMGLGTVIIIAVIALVTTSLEGFFGTALS